jgi:hypothetical protein
VVPYQIPPQEAARDRGVLQRLSLSHTIGRQMIIRRQQLRTPNNQHPGGPQPNNQRRPGGLQPNNQRPGGPQPNNQRPGGLQPNRPGGQQPLNRLQRGQPRQRPPKEKNQ